MAHSPKTTLPPDFRNPFEGRNPDEVWQELNERAKPISREEFLQRLQEQRQLNAEKQATDSSKPDEKDA